jgi:hypothetical protein
MARSFCEGKDVLCSVVVTLEPDLRWGLRCGKSAAAWYSWRFCRALR